MRPTTTSCARPTRPKRSGGWPSAPGSNPERSWSTWRRGPDSSRVGSSGSASPPSPAAPAPTSAPGCSPTRPAPNIRAVLATTRPDVTAVPGTAEAIPLGDGEADAVVVGNAFHHFDAQDAFAEIRRVLRPGGALALFWDGTDEPADGLRLGIREIDEVVERERASSPVVEAYFSWFDPPERIDGFTALERHSFATTRTISSA